MSQVHDVYGDAPVGSRMAPEYIDWYLDEDSDGNKGDETVLLERLEKVLRGPRDYNREFAALCATTVRSFDELSREGQARLLELLRWYVRVRRPSEADHMLADGVVREYRMELSLALLQEIMDSRWHDRVSRLGHHLEFLYSRGADPEDPDGLQRREVWEAMAHSVREQWPGATPRRRRALSAVQSGLAKVGFGGYPG